jgi:hypothetical protein
MKKFLFLLVFAFLASAVQAQNGDLYSFIYHDMTGYFYQINSSVQQRDGDHIIDIYLLEDAGNYIGIPWGNMCYKISPTTLDFTDSLFVQDTAIHSSLLVRDPRGEGNIRAVFEYHEDCDSSFVRISHFPDNDLHTNHEEDIVVPLCEGAVWEGRYGSLLDCRNDLIMTYYKKRTEISSDQYIVRIGLDGTLKQQTLLAENLLYDVGALRVLKESPLQYYQWNDVSDYNNNLAIYMIDSLFHRNTTILNRVLSEEFINQYISVYEYLTIGFDTEVIPAGGDDVLVAAQYTYDTNYLAWTQDRGVAVAKYDTRTMQLKGYAVFNDFHSYSSIGTPMGLKMMEDGTVYFLYKEYYYPEESIMVVKMDVNLNVEWKRFCKTNNIIMSSTLESPILFEDETREEKGIAWCGYGHKDGNYDRLGWVYFLLYHDGTVGINESGIEVRPYCFYPNPAKDQLHLQYSPDVKPARIELYDLHGRLVRSQCHSLESVEMQGLSAGQYLMKVTLEDGKSYTDKVVKE